MASPLRPFANRALLIGATAFLCAALANLTPWVQILELKTLDLLFLIRGPLAPPRDVVIVAIDEASFGDVKFQWPWPRRLHAKLVDRLRADGARVIVFDVLFPEASSRSDDEAFARAIRRAGNVVLAAELSVTSDPRFRQTTVVKPHDPLEAAAAGIGVATIYTDPDVFVRRVRASVEGFPSLAHSGAQMWLAARGGKGPGPRRVPRDEDLLIDFVGPPRTIRTASYYQVIGEQRELPEGFFRDKLVFIGRSVLASPEPQRHSADVYPTPFAWSSETLMPAVEINANAAATLLEGRALVRLGGPLWWVLLLAFGLGGAALVSPWRPSRGALALAVLVAALVTGGYYTFARGRLWIPLVTLTIQSAVVYVASLGLWYLETEREGRWVRTAFSRYVSPTVLKDLLAHPDRLELGGREAETTIVFTDLVGFSAMAERRTPREIVATINEYLVRFTEIIFHHGGTLDKFMGDGIMAFWGAPVETPDHALRACRAALEMRDAMEVLKARWAARRYPPSGVRIGINTGPAIVGNIGSRGYFSYTAMGDATNTASRLEQVNKNFGTSIVISESTHWAVKDEVVARELGTITVRGRAEPVTIYELVAVRGEAIPDGQRELLEGYEKALAAFKAARRDEAAGALEALLTRHGDDGPSRELLRRCREGA